MELPPPARARADRARPRGACRSLGSCDAGPLLAVRAPALSPPARRSLGFLTLGGSVPATIFVVALAERELRAPRTGRAVALAIVAAGLLYLHPSALGLALGSAVLLALTAGTGWRRGLRSVAPFAPAVALLAAWMAASLFAQSPGGHA